MVYVLTYQRDGRTVRHSGTRAAMAALADYVARTFRVTPTVALAA